MTEKNDSDNWIASSYTEQFDIALAEFDCLATQAHVLMLNKQGIISSNDAAKALAALEEIKEICINNQFRYYPGLGAQLTLEKMIVERAGDHVGYQVHTGRSRNDQVMVAQKLYVRNRVLDLASSLEELISRLINLADNTVDLIIPGYTHMQPARPTTVAQWAAAYCDMFLKDLKRLELIYQLNDTSPLGAAESHGTTWNIDRQYSSELLGFQGVDEIPLAAISSRGESDTDFLNVISFISLHLSKFAQDLLLFTTFEYGYVELGSSQATRMGKLTGSSIMPQKKNPDVLELLRSQAGAIYSYLLHSFDVLKGLPTGYNRDSRDTKDPIINGLNLIISAVDQASGVVDSLEFKKEKMREAIDKNYSMATDLAEYLAQTHNIPFREMHTIVGEVVKEAIKNNRLIEDIQPIELKESAMKIGIEFNPTREDIKVGANPEQAIERRNNLGGSSKEQMEIWSGNRKDQLNDLTGWRIKQLKIINSSKEKIKTLSKQLIKEDK